jgi:hypothetical protein
MVRRSFAIAAVAAAVGLPSFTSAPAWAAPKDKEKDKDECVDAHSRGQDLREKGQLTRARQVFLSCAQSSCPGLIQGDCARFGEDLDRLVPTVSFTARDAKAVDLPSTSVYVDDTLVATRLDDGKSYNVDPGKHIVRFVHDGKETTITAVLTQGEKGRVLIATFIDRTSTSSPTPTDTPAPTPQPKRPIFPLVVAGIGAAAMATGGVLLGLGLHQVPSSCSMSSKECAAAPGDPAVADAQSGTSLANVGLGVGLGGAAMLIGGVVWYLVQPATLPTEPTRAAFAHPLVTPFIGKGSGGVAVQTSF